MSKNFSISYSKKDFQSSTSIKWCPGCGDYSIYNAVIHAFAKLNTLREDFLVVSGIGCSSRFPYYCQTYGFHTLHGRAPTIAMGAKTINNKLSVWIVTGDGDALSIGGNHFIHIIRKNPDIKIMLFNNQIYGLTKGQYSPTSKSDLKTKTSPFGVIETPIKALTLALVMGATFIARAVATDTKHMQNIIIEAGKHKGIAVIEILTNCIIFNDDAFYPFEAKLVRNDNIVFLDNEKPLIYGKNKDKGLVLKNLNIEIINITEKNMKDVLIHKKDSENNVLHFSICDLQYPKYPLPVGIFKQILKPSYHDTLNLHKSIAIQKAKIKNVDDLLNSGDTWVIE
jgi:2-oxoglutarate ferredoxin oxidoreductase subunit beta